ncbi:MAG: glycosyltransferase family 2 protein, partial [Flavobacteriales bacterium]|nr:glycosyltransferase family 2 protein [Flavobacteriales bacterium]
VNDYLFSLNPYVKDCRDDWVFILNDDMKLAPDVFMQLLPVMAADPNLFAITCNVNDWEGTEETHGLRRFRITKGSATSYWSDQKADKEKLYHTLYPGGGSAVFSVQKYNQLEGFDPLFRPAYAEDLDLGYRAWKMGWPTVYAPKAILYHREGATIQIQFENSALIRKITRNTMAWYLKNIHTPAFLLKFFVYLPYRLVYFYIYNRNYYFAMKSVLGSLSAILKARKKASKASVQSDEQIMKLLNNTPVYTVQAN